MTKRALILGIGGMDGSYLAELLLEKQYKVHGLYRRSSVDNLWRVRHVLDRLTLYRGDLADPLSVERALVAAQPHELFLLADQDHVGHSYDAPGYSLDITAGAVARTLESVRQLNPSMRIFQPCTALMFGAAPPPQDERTPFAPASPYAVAKVAAYYACQHYRREYGMFVSTAILFNHDSPRRQGDYLLHHLACGALRVARGEAQTLPVGDPDMEVDIGHAKEYVAAMWQIMQLGESGDFVLATGRPYTVNFLARRALYLVGADGDGRRVVCDPSLKRPGPQPSLIGDASKAKAAFGFAPEYVASDMIGIVLDSLIGSKS